MDRLLADSFVADKEIKRRSLQLMQAALKKRMARAKVAVEMLQSAAESEEVEDVEDDNVESPSTGDPQPPFAVRGEGGQSSGS